jgi:HEAT repeat protein
MRRLFGVLAVLLILGSVAAGRVHAQAEAQGQTEDELIAVLQSGQALPARAEACARLKLTATARSVPALEKLLTDDQLSHSARYVLESLPGREAENALRAALATTSGSNLVGVIDSLGERRETAAASDLANLLGSKEQPVAVAAAEALGKIGGENAVKLLEKVWDPAGTGAVHAAQTDALLAAANQLAEQNEARSAGLIFRLLYDHDRDPAIKLAAFRGLILTSGKKGPAMLIDAIKNGDEPTQSAALELTAKLSGPATTRALASLLIAVPDPVKISLLQALQQRGDRMAAPFVVEMVSHRDKDVRVAAIVALGDLGDETAAMVLAQQAASAAGAEKSAAREALLNLRHGNVGGALVKGLRSSTPEVQGELIRALSGRGETFAAPQLLELAQSGDDNTRAAALQGLSVLAGPPQVPGLIALIVSATNDDFRSAAADTLAAACQNIQAHGGQIDAAALAEAAKSSPRDTQIALLEVCGGVTDPRMREVLRAAATSSDAGVRAEGVRSLCSSQDEALLPDMLKIAAPGNPPNYRLLGLRGAVRLLTDDPSHQMADEQKSAGLKSLREDAFNLEGKRLVLSGLAKAPSLTSLELAESFLDDAEVTAEAEEATVQIARGLGHAHREKAEAALRRVLAAKPEASVRKSAQAALRKVRAAE